jgi:hypothetical protein|tara:strand:+ start:5834 stop:6025 length:192 start_codon:yes stop_codon:yes gene_type:complete
MEQRNISLKDGTTLEVSIKPELIEQIKREYSIDVVTDKDIKNFFEDVLSDAIRNAEINSPSDE